MSKLDDPHFLLGYSYLKIMVYKISSSSCFLTCMDTCKMNVFLTIEQPIDQTIGSAYATWFFTHLFEAQSSK